MGGGGVYRVCWGRKSSCEEVFREYHGEEYNVKKGKGKQYVLFYDFKTVGKNIKWGKGDGSFGISSSRELYTPLLICKKKKSIYIYNFGISIPSGICIGFPVRKSSIALLRGSKNTRKSVRSWTNSNRSSWSQDPALLFK